MIFGSGVTLTHPRRKEGTVVADRTWEEPGEGDLNDRLQRLERMAAGWRDQELEGGRLSAGVEQLGVSTAALTQVLLAVDEQARNIARVDRKAEQVAFTAEERAATAHIERKLFLRRTYLAALATMVLTVGAVIGGAWLTDKHLQDCVLHGPKNAAERAFCNTTFPGHDHPEELSLDELLAAGSANQLRAVLAQRDGCERVQARVRIEIEKERALAVTDLPETRAAHARAAASLEPTLIDCDAEYPLPLPRAGGTR